jgi:hypothetical protein
MPTPSYRHAGLLVAMLAACSSDSGTPSADAASVDSPSPIIDARPIIVDAFPSADDAACSGISSLACPFSGVCPATYTTDRTAWCDPRADAGAGGLLYTLYPNCGGYNIARIFGLDTSDDLYYALAGQFLLNRHSGFPGTPPTSTPGITPVDVATCTATPIECR